MGACGAACVVAGGAFLGNVPTLFALPGRRHLGEGVQGGLRYVGGRIEVGVAAYDGEVDGGGGGDFGDDGAVGRRKDGAGDDGVDAALVLEVGVFDVRHPVGVEDEVDAYVAAPDVVDDTARGVGRVFGHVGPGEFACLRAFRHDERGGELGVDGRGEVADVVGEDDVDSVAGADDECAQACGGVVAAVFEGFDEACFEARQRASEPSPEAGDVRPGRYGVAACVL